jgi:transposase-like protein
MKMPKPILTEEKYVEKQGVVCPVCHRKDGVVGNNWIVGPGFASQECECNYCNSEWVDDYKLIGYSDLQQTVCTKEQ